MWIWLWSMLAVGQANEAIDLPTVSVISRRPEAVLSAPLSVRRIDPQPEASHPNEVLDAAAGAWVSRGSGQEHLTAIRSPVLTGAGACGAFLYAENGIPIRPPGFCNVNNLFELVWERAARFEVLAGPGSALYGANALHGAVNTVMPAPAADNSVRLGLGKHDYQSLQATLGGDRWLAAAVATHSGSFREQEHFDQQKLHLRADAAIGDFKVQSWLSAVNLNQETAGFILGFEAYADPALRRANLNPEAFRHVQAYRAASRWRTTRSAWNYELTPYARSSRMDFLQHFLPGKPLEENGQDSIAVQFLARRRGAVDWTLGLDIDYADGFLRETQDAPILGGSDFLRETRPAGKHYDYRVDSLMTGVYAQAHMTFAEHWEIAAGLRAERLSYHYDNRLAAGNRRPDGTPCGFGGCLFNRPADRSDAFTELAPKLTLSHRGRRHHAYLRLARGFRPPQATELYRLQSGQSVAELDSEKLDAAELGLKLVGDRWLGSIAAYHMDKRNFIFRDADGFNVADGKTRHRGLELDLSLRPNGRWSFDAALSLADHRYAFDRDAAQGETIRSGNEIDTAPETLARGRLARNGVAGGAVALEWVHVGDYFLDAANQHHYGGHDLLHLGWQGDFGAWRLGLRLENILNEAYAERADFAFGNYRYFPGQGRTWLVSLGWRP